MEQSVSGFGSGQKNGASLLQGGVCQPSFATLFHFPASQPGNKKSKVHFFTWPLAHQLACSLFQVGKNPAFSRLLTPTGALVMMMVYYISEAATFSDFHSVH